MPVTDLSETLLQPLSECLLQPLVILVIDCRACAANTLVVLVIN